MHNIPRKLPTQGKSKDKEVCISTLNHKTTAAVSGRPHSKHTSHWSVAVCHFWALASLTDAVTCGWRWCTRTGWSTLCEVPSWPMTSPKHGLTAGPRLARWPNVDKKIWCDVGVFPSVEHRFITEDSWQYPRVAVLKRKTLFDYKAVVAHMLLNMRLPSKGRALLFVKRQDR